MKVTIGHLTLVGLRGKRDPFHREVKKLKRPYIKITTEERERLETRKFDYFLLNNERVVTVGTADGGFVLMPLQQKYAKKVIHSNRGC